MSLTLVVFGMAVLVVLLQVRVIAEILLADDALEYVRLPERRLQHLLVRS